MNRILSYFKNKPYKKEFNPSNVDSYRNSYKEWEILEKKYVYDKYSRELVEYPAWRHYRYYKTEQSAIDAIRDIRRGWWTWAYYDFPGIAREKNFPHINPVITLHRYKIIRREPVNIGKRNEN